MKKGDRPLRFHIIVSGTGREHFKKVIHRFSLVANFQ